MNKDLIELSRQLGDEDDLFNIINQAIYNEGISPVEAWSEAREVLKAIGGLDTFSKVVVREILVRILYTQQHVFVGGSKESAVRYQAVVLGVVCYMLMRNSKTIEEDPYVEIYQLIKDNIDGDPVIQRMIISAHDEEEKWEKEHGEIPPVDYFSDAKKSNKDDDVLNGLEPFFFGDRDEARKFLNYIKGKESTQITSQVNHLLNTKKIDSKIKKKDLWAILHDNGLYSPTQSYWNRVVKMP